MNQEAEIEISHTCPEIEEEKLRLHDTGFVAIITVEVSTTDDWETRVTLFSGKGEDETLVSIDNIHVKCCPYCGTRLPSIVGVVK